MKQYRLVLAILLILLFVSFIPSVSAASDSTAGYIVVGLAPIADFEAHYAYNVLPTTVRFVDRSSGTAPLMYLWDFGDGTTSTESAPVHIYTNRGLYTVKLTVKNAYGESTETKVDYIAIGVGPIADFTADPKTGSVPFVVQFTDRSAGHPTKWVWNFGDGTGSTDQNPVHTYWTGGRYTVSLTASNDYAMSDATKTEYIIAIPALKSKFDAYPMTGRAPVTVKFTDRSLGDPTSWKWDFGDGSTSTDKNPSHTFTSGGAFDVVLEVIKGEDSDRSTQVINVGGVPVTDFSADKTSVNTEEMIQFTDKTKNTPSSWKWNFGDGSESSAQNPVKAYTVKGIFTVSLTAKNENGRDTEIKTKYINVGLSPVADFVTSIPAYQNIPSRQTVRFIDKSENMPTEWLWNFGDGQTSAEQNPRHIYLRDGIYTVTLTAKNKFGQSTKVAENLITVGLGPRVDFKADRTVSGVDQFIRFMDLSNNNPTSWVWDFGDGSTGYGKSPDHAYKKIGMYDVTLTASNQYTSTSLTKKQYITIINIPRADFVADKTKGQAPFTVSFTDKSKGSPTAWSWNFGDGSTSTDQNPKHTYTTNGIYTVALTASNANGGDTDTKEQYINVRMGPVADFQVNERIGKAPFIVKFQDTSSGSPNKWLWEFGDGTSSKEQNPAHIYLREGAYDVRLTVWNNDGSDTVFKSGTTG
ncbi:MAG: PKD domain protein [Methanoregula sp. PtaU1.Bin051]|nr:MAG: PKD domain protein [Methanoregula sp. PtaU1.Bin051]